MNFNPGIEIISTQNPLGFKYGKDVFGPVVENRSLDSIRKSLKNPNCAGPDPVYSIAMDVGLNKHKETLHNLHLLFGVVTFAAGRLGNEPVRSQGHIHKKSPKSGWSTPEVYEIWSGKAIIYMQESATDNPGRCFAVEAEPGEVVIVPPNWAHATISADPQQPLTFGAWCDRAYGFEYDDVRAHNGLAWFPILDTNGKLCWERNEKYQKSDLIIKKPNEYKSIGIERKKSIYKLFENNPEMFLFVPQPNIVNDFWINFIP